jgi:asparagine synthase (glutamine-hydrolysing)
MFHSAGKDSNSIALALAEAGWQKKVVLISHKSKGQADESEISASIAKKLGFRHRILEEIDQLRANHKRAIHEFFARASLPCVDSVTLAYPLYALQLPELFDSNIIDGGGNDSYMMTPLGSKDRFLQRLSIAADPISGLGDYLCSTSLWQVLLRTNVERFGMTGLSFRDAAMIFPSSHPVRQHWRRVYKNSRHLDDIEIKTNFLTTVIASEQHIRKVRVFADALGSNLILPWANNSLAEFFSKVPEQYLFERATGRNKIFLRNLLKERLELDSDALGKMGFTYDSQSIVENNFGWMRSAILQCSLWHKPAIIELISHLSSKRGRRGRSGKAARLLLYRLYLMSEWHTQHGAPKVENSSIDNQQSISTSQLID